MWQRNIRIRDGQVKIKESLHRMIREDVRTVDGLVLQMGTYLHFQLGNNLLNFGGFLYTIIFIDDWVANTTNSPYKKKNHHKRKHTHT